MLLVSWFFLGCGDAGASGVLLVAAVEEAEASHKPGGRAKRR